MDSTSAARAQDILEIGMVEDIVALGRAFRPPAPELPSGSVPPLQLLWAVFFNPLHVWRRQHFEDPVVVERTILGARLVVSDPALIKWILVDNAQNYVRDSLQRRLLYRVTGAWCVFGRRLRLAVPAKNSGATLFCQGCGCLSSRDDCRRRRCDQSFSKLR